MQAFTAGLTFGILLTGLGGLATDASARKISPSPSASVAERSGDVQAQNSVVLKFAWPDGSRQMTYSRSRTRDGASAGLFSASWTMSCVRTPGGFSTISWSKPVMPSAADTHALQDVLERLQPPIVVDGGGQFVRVLPGGSEAMLQSILDLLGKDSVPASARPTILSMLDARSSNFWKGLVGRWASRALTFGATFPVETKTTIAPGLPEIAVSGSGRIVESKACGARAARCVEVDEVFTLQPADFVKAAAALAAGFGEEMVRVASKIKIERIVVRSHIVTEPGTLVPHLARSEREMTVSFGGGKPHTEVDTEEWTFASR